MKPREEYRLESLPEAYSRVTDAERFRPLHDRALVLLARLRGTFQVSERETFELLPGLMHAFDHARPPVTLTPITPDAAPIAIGFTSFPSLVVRCGRWFSTAFPGCACDACAATATDEGARLEQLVEDVTSGVFREELTIPLLGTARLRWWLGSAAAGDRHRGEGMTTLPREHAQALRAGGAARVQWRPWQRRDER